MLDWLKAPTDRKTCKKPQVRGSYEKMVTSHVRVKLKYPVLSMYSGPCSARFKRYSLPMTRERQTNIILAALAVLAGGWFYTYVQSEHRAAIATGDYGRCWTDSCKTAVSYSHYIR